MPVVVRRVRPAEYGAAGRVTRDGYLADGLLTFENGEIDRDYERRLLDVAARDREAEVLVALDDAHVIGTVTWCPPGSPWRELATRPDQGEFRMLSVAAAGRGRGVGGTLVDACLDRARREQAGEVLLSSLPEMTAAHRLYGRLGFVRDPSLDHSPKPFVHLWGFRLTLHTD